MVKRSRAPLPGNTRSRAKLARRLLDLLAVDVLLAQTDEALFHGDPHAGNVFHVLDDPADPFRLALLDWGLSGNLPHSQREALMQLFLGIFLKDPKRLRNHVGALIEGDSWETESGQKRVRQLVEQTLTEVKGGSAFDVLGELMKNLGREGYQDPLQPGALHQGADHNQWNPLRAGSVPGQPPSRIRSSKKCPSVFFTPSGSPLGTLISTVACSPTRM